MLFGKTIHKPKILEKILQTKNSASVLVKSEGQTDCQVGKPLKSIHWFCQCCSLILSLVQFLFSFVSYLL